MSEFASSFFESAVGYLGYGIVGSLGLIIGGSLGWWLKSKWPLTSSAGQTARLGTPSGSRAPGRPIDFAESDLLTKIASELGRIEAALSMFTAVRPNPPALKDKLSVILQRLESIRVTTQKTRAAAPAVPVISAARFETTDDIPAPSLGELSEPSIITQPKPRTFAEQFIDMYNSARDDRDTRNEFWGKYQFEQLGNRNTTDQRMGRASEPDFRTSESLGDFIAVRDPESEHYLVVPSFTISVDDTSFRFGGLEAAFSCDFAAGSTYQSFSVSTPAEFSKTGDNWSVISRGELLLDR